MGDAEIERNFFYIKCKQKPLINEQVKYYGTMSSRVWILCKVCTTVLTLYSFLLFYIHVTFSWVFVSPTYQYFCGPAHTVWSCSLIDWARSQCTTTTHQKEVFQTSAHRTVVCMKPSSMLFQSIFPGQDPSRHTASFFLVLSLPYLSDDINQSKGCHVYLKLNEISSIWFSWIANSRPYLTPHI